MINAPDVRVEFSITGNQVNECSIRCQAGTTHPDAALARTRSGVPNPELLECAGAVSHHPTVVGLVVTMRAPGNVDSAIQEQEPSPLVLLCGIKGNCPASRI